MHRRIRLTKNIITGGLSAILVGIMFPTTIYAQNFCDTFPTLCGVTGTSNPGEDAAQNYLLDRVSMVITFIFAWILTIGIYIIVRASIRYINSRGSADEMTGATNSIRNVFIGMGLLFVGVVGIILVLAFYNGQGLLGTELTVDDLFRPGG